MPTEYLLMIPPLAPTKPNRPGLSRIWTTVSAIAVQGVAVAGPAEVRQPAGQREAARVVGRQPERLADQEHGEREAAVQVERGDVVDADPRHAQRLVGGEHRGRT